MKVELSVLNFSLNCVICKQPRPEGSFHSHPVAEGITHVACLPCVQNLQNNAQNRSVLCPEECGYDFNPPRNCLKKTSRWWSRQSPRLAGWAKSAIKNPIVIMLSSGAAALGITAAVSRQTSLIVLGSCALLPVAKLIYDLWQRRPPSTTPFFVGLIPPYLGLFIEPVSENGFNVVSGLISLIAGLAPYVDIYARPRDLDQPISFRYAVVVNSIASVLFFGSSLLGGAKIDVAGAAGSITFGFSTLVAACSRIRR